MAQRVDFGKPGRSRGRGRRAGRAGRASVGPHPSAAALPAYALLPYSQSGMRSARLWISLAAFPIGLALADLALGRYLVGDGTQLPPVPPFGRLEEAQRDEAVSALLRSRKGMPAPTVNRFDAELGWTNVPGWTSDGSTCTNSLGARGQREYSPLPEQGTTRLVCYGSSFVYGSEVGDEDCWPRQVERMDPHFEALNMGVGGYGSDQALLRFRRKGLLGAQIAVMGLNLEDICRNVNRYRAIYVPLEAGAYPKPRFLCGPSGELELLPQPYSTRTEMLEAVLEERIVDELAPHEYWSEAGPWLPCSTTLRVLAARAADERRRLSYQLWLQPESEPYRVTLAILEAFDREARAAGAQRCLLLVFGLRKDMLSYQALKQKYWRPALEELARRGLETLDMNDSLLEFEPEQVFRQTHYSEAGNATVAEALLEHLRR